jgi:4-hydroxybenzoate polyprenyltransferase
LARVQSKRERPLGDALLPYLKLVRAPAVFSALGDPLAGLLLDDERLDVGRASRLSAASALIYLAGMALNDLADREEDARERPERPIPSGAISPRAAALVGGSLLLAGTYAAWRGGARWTGPALAAAVVAYDFKLKHSNTLGPVAMGACRSLSLLMGVEAASEGVSRRGTEGALLLGAYVAGLTLVARGETGAARTTELRTGAALAAAALLATAIRGGPSSLPWAAATGALAGPALSRALRDPGPKSVGPAVGALIRAIPALDGAIAGTRAPKPAMVLVSLLALTRWGRTLIPIT